MTEHELWKKEYQESILNWIAGNTSLIERVLRSTIINYGACDHDTAGAFVEVKGYPVKLWFGWDFFMGERIVVFNDWGNSIDGEIYPDGTYEIHTYDD